MNRLEKPGFTIGLTLIFIFLSAGIAVSGLRYYQGQKRIIQQQRNEELGAIGEARNYRGVAVIAATRRIANSPWILVAKVDLEEIHAYLWQSAMLTGVAGLFLFVAAATGVLLLWREQQGRFYRRQHTSQMEKAVLVERLDALSRHANDIVLWADHNGQIQDANERAVLSYGYERADLLRLTMSELLPSEARPDFERRWTCLGKEYDMVLESEHQRKDSSRFPVEISTRLMVFGKNVCCQSIIRDISERKRAEEELRWLSSIVESTDDAIIGENLEGIVVSWNKGAERIYGYSAGEMVGRPISILVPPQCPDDSPRIMESLKRGQSIEHFETERMRRDGQCIFVSITVSALKDRANQVTGASVIARDISQRKQVEAELAKAHRGTKTILQSISDGVNAFDREWRYTYVNATGAKLVGKTPEELLGKIFWEVWPDAADSPFGVAYRRAVAEKVLVQVEAFYTPLNRWCEVRCYPSPEGLVLFFSDTTERKRKEKALQVSEERYRSLVLATTQIVWNANPKGEAVDDVPMWRAFTGQSLAEIKGWGRFEAVHPADRERAMDIWSKAVKNRGFYDTEYRLRRHDGEYRWMSAHGVPVMEGEEVVREWVGTCTDVTERRQAEEEIQKLNQHLEQSVLERTAQLYESNQELEAFAYSVSHDLRAPLRAVNAFSRILLEEYAPQLPADARHCVDMTCKNALQMGELIDGLLMFSRLNRQALRKQPVAPADLVRQAWEDLRAEHAGRLIEFNVGSLAPCEGDTLLLRQVFVNLLSNALKYTRTREISRIEVGSAGAAVRSGTGLPAGDCPVYFVRDNGVGFDVRYKNKLFGVFQRLHRAEDYEGSGVGLATVQRIVHRHGGEVWADSVLNEGATFYFTLSDAGKSSKGDGNRGG